MIVIVSTATMILGGTGCSTRKSAGLSGNNLDISYKSGQNTPLESECERELLFLDKLIESRRGAENLSAAVFAEAVELRRVAAGLLLDEQYDLALEMIEEAIALLREP
jgi:hypothetical protein